MHGTPAHVWVGHAGQVKLKTEEQKRARTAPRSESPTRPHECWARVHNFI
jgi:hypothetical protein